MEDGQEVNTEFKFTGTSRHQNAGQNQNVPIATKSFDNCGKIQNICELTVTNQIVFTKKLRAN
jgi:hypothetical protein